MKTPKPHRIAAVFLAMLFLLQGGMPLAAATGVSYDVLYGYQGGMAVFEKDGKQGAMNARQKVVIPPIYDYISLFEYGLARILIDGKWGMVRDTGETVIEPAYDYISAFIAEAECPPNFPPMACLLLKQKMGFVDASGKVICEPRFDKNTQSWWEKYSYEGIYVQENGLWGIMGADGHMVAEPQYPYPFPWERKHEYAYITDTGAINGLTPDDIIATCFGIEGQDLEKQIALFSAVWKNTKWYRADAWGNMGQEITNADDLTALPYFRKGVTYHEFELQGLSEEEDPYVVVYMNSYGDVLRILRNRQYEAEDRSGEFWAWDLWDMN